MHSALPQPYPDAVQSERSAPSQSKQEASEQPQFGFSVLAHLGPSSFVLDSVVSFFPEISIKILICGKIGLLLCLSSPKKSDPSYPSLPFSFSSTCLPSNKI